MKRYSFEQRQMINDVPVRQRAAVRSIVATKKAVKHASESLEGRYPVFHGG